MAPTAAFSAILAEAATNATAAYSGSPVPNPNPNLGPNAKLLANLVARVTLAVLGTLLCGAPLRVLSRNGEFAAAVLVATVCGLNAITVVNSLLWRGDDWARWPSGRGLCDLEVYLLVPLDTTYAAAVFAVVRRLAAQMRLTAAGMPLAASRTSLGGGGGRGGRAWRERIRGVLGQAAVIFAVPLVQVVFTYFDLAQRFVVGTLVGCSAVYDNSLPKILVFDVPPAAFAIASVPYAYLTYTRYRTISNLTTAALGPRNAPATARAHRTRRRLYGMCVAILTAYLPLQLFLAAEGIRDTATASGTAAGSGSLQTYNFGRIHSEVAGSSPEHRHAWSSILFVPSWLVPFHVMNQPYIAILTTGVVFAFFGLGDEAKEIYRGYARWWSWWWSAALCRCRGRRDGGGGDDGEDDGIGSTQRRTSAPQHLCVGVNTYGRPRRHRRGQYSISDESLVMDTIEMTAVKQDTSLCQVEQQADNRHTEIYTSADPLPATPKRTRAQTSHYRRNTRNCSDVPDLPNPRPRRNHKKKHARGDSEVTVGSALSVPPSPLESTAVIRPMIPPRTSSLRNAGARRFRLPSLAPSFTLATLPSLPSVISFGRRQRQRRKESKGKGKGEGKQKGDDVGHAVVEKGEGDDEWVECDDGVAGSTTMTTATTESDLFGGVGGAGNPVSRLGMGHATGNINMNANANAYANVDANAPRLGSPSKHRARAHHPTEPMPPSAMAMRFPPRHDSLSSISVRREEIPSTSGGLAATAAVTREVANFATHNDINGEGPHNLRNDRTAVATTAKPDFSLGGGALDEDGSNHSWRMTSAGSVSVEASSNFSSSELPALALAKTRGSRPQSYSALVSASASTERAQEEQQARASLAMSLLPPPTRPRSSSGSPQEPRQPAIVRSARSPVSPSLPIPTPVPVPVALAFRPARRRVLVRGDHGGEAREAHDDSSPTAAAAGVAPAGTEAAGAGDWQPDRYRDHDPRPSHTMDLLGNGSDGGTPTRTLFPANGAPYIFTAGTSADTNDNANGNRSSPSISTSMQGGRGGGGASSPLLRTRDSSGEEASSEASTEVEFGMAVTGRLLRPSVIAGETEIRGGFAPLQQ
ncbi:hypothetical protein SLS62_001708 [Diatrype stigma]|uniref:Pheromone receptor n=1 Tax=Diatrype stigma TaxID=117547 RepID=A0AAN9UY91_9PEZI